MYLRAIEKMLEETRKTVQEMAFLESEETEAKLEKSTTNNNVTGNFSAYL